MTSTTPPTRFAPIAFLVPLAIAGAAFVLAEAYAAGSAYAIEATADLVAAPWRCAVDVVSIFCSVPEVTVGGSVVGLNDDTTTAVVLELNGEEVALAKDGSFVFSAPLVRGATYSVKIAEPPDGETCALARASGTAGDVDVTDVTVTCAPNGA